MEQKLYITDIRENIGIYALSELSQEPKLKINTDFELTKMRLTDDTFFFTLNGTPFKLNRHWQVLGTEIYGIPNPYMVEMVRYVMFFTTNEGDKNSDYARLQELGSQMIENEYSPWILNKYGIDWKSPAIMNPKVRFD